MLHEILLSLSGHPSPLLRNDFSEFKAQAVLSPPERELLRTARHISNLHRKLIGHTTQISASHPSVICRAVSTATKSDHLAAFQRKILEVEDSILRRDAALVGAYDIVPLTAVIGEFSGWTRRLEWLWELAQFMLSNEKAPPCRAAHLIDKLRNELQTGYADIEQTALSLVKVAETAWLKQVSAWVLYGRIPVFGENDFFIREGESDEQGYSINYDLLPSFVTPYTANSMLFIGTSLNRVRTGSSAVPGDSDLRHLSSQLRELSNLTFPLCGPMLSRAITSIRLTLSRTTLQKLLPLAKVLEMLQLLRDFFLIGRGEFAMALTQQADEKVRGRWRRADNLAYEKRDGFGTIVVKEGEVAAALNRTWAVLGAMQGEHAEEDEELELARDLLRLNLPKTKTSSPMKAKVDAGQRVSDRIVATPFRNLLFSVPVILTLQVPSPLDLFLSTSDLDTYTAINSYLLSIRRAHLRLTDFWKITSLRRHHPAPPRPPYSSTRGGIAKTRTLRERYSARSSVMRSPWSTSSAAIFFLAETEAYLQVEVVEGLWEHFHNWVTGSDQCAGQRRSAPPLNGPQPPTHRELDVSDSDGETAELSQHTTAGRSDRRPRIVAQQHDPQTLSAAHRLYLRALTRRLLLTRTSFTDPLYALLIHIDHLVALIHRLDGIWTSIDLEADEGVVDAFSNLEAEEKDVLASLRDVEAKVKHGIEDATGALRSLSMDSAFLAELEGDGDGFDAEEDESAEAGSYGDDAGIYRPRRVGGVDRLLMKLDFGGWFDSDGAGYDAVGDDVF
ncbi:hypothetical protein DL766_009930 [Monosporascus sp. MC13-8B]|uniref:Spindle pole body component n=1 Tax=Monosporascus cannonballus TaxID=155416 RepID=A0ABY0GTH8_9PEZI|nr:hypothetical protein DL762_009495 [Monosporascus cannonballus]RYO78641.1 hypothetical protein DL763_009560 [Monosporascus cannonballus]RYP12726.1 hypothetical protein DL766_009930 [Monosporascus sp. MC13-8B]